MGLPAPLCVAVVLASCVEASWCAACEGEQEGTCVDGVCVRIHRCVHVCGWHLCAFACVCVCVCVCVCARARARARALVCARVCVHAT